MGRRKEAVWEERWQFGVGWSGEFSREDLQEERDWGAKADI